MNTPRREAIGVVVKRDTESLFVERDGVLDMVWGFPRREADLSDIDVRDAEAAHVLATQAGLHSFDFAPKARVDVDTVEGPVAIRIVQAISYAGNLVQSDGLHPDWYSRQAALGRTISVVLDGCIEMIDNMGRFPPSEYLQTRKLR